MSESKNPDLPESAPLLAQSSAPLTAGQMIRAARVQMGMHLAVLSVNLKVPVRQLEALEADEHDPNKGPVFVRALASSVCRQLHMDPAPVLALLPQSVDRMPLEKPTLESRNSPRRVQWNVQSVIRAIPFQTVAIAAVMVMLIAALLWMPSPSTWAWLQPAPRKAEAVVPPTPVLPPQSEASAELSTDSAPAIPATTATPAPGAQPMVQPVQSASAPQVAPAAIAPKPIAPSPSTPAPANPASGALMVFSATNDSWIEIRDSKNQVLWSRVVHAGENAQVQFSPPMHVVIGRAHVVSVTYKGKPFDLTPHTKATVARFEVKE